MDLGEVVGCLEDLITYFAQPEDDLGHEEKQKFLKALRNRQDLFQEEGILNLILDCIDKMNAEKVADPRTVTGEKRMRPVEAQMTILVNFMPTLMN